jgi:small subunit ribosomal protein S17
MTEEEKQQQEDQPTDATETQADEPAAEETPADEPAAEETPAEEPEAEQAQGDDADAVADDAEQPAAEAPAQDEDGAGETDLGPKARRKLERSRASGPPRPSRTPSERAAERAERRRAAGESRRRYRAARRQQRGESGTGTPPAPGEPGAKKVRQGTVVSAGANKTITVEIAVVRRHPTYEKVVRRTSKLRAHDEANEANEGDLVRVVESRPLSRTKRWRLLDVLERAPR